MKAYIFLLLLVFSSGCIAIDIEEYRDETRALISMEEYEEALERTIWLHNNVLEHDSSMYGVRLSFALSNWYDLGKKYPPALAALRKTRDDKTNLVLSGKGNPELFHDVTSINRTLSEDNKSIELFHALDSKQPKFAKQAWHFIKDLIIKSKDYKLIDEYIGNLVVAYSRNEMRFIEMHYFYEKNKEEFGNEQHDFAKNNYIEKTKQLITIANELNDEKAIELIIKKATMLSDEYKLDYDFNKNHPNN